MVTRFAHTILSYNDETLAYRYTGCKRFLLGSSAAFAASDSLRESGVDGVRHSLLTAILFRFIDLKYTVWYNTIG